MITRRHLIATAACGLAAPALARVPGGDTRTVASTGAVLPVVGLGTWITFNVGSDSQLLARSVDVMLAFFEEGGGMIDSSPMYGSAQQTIGHGLEALGDPAGLFSADKVWTSSAGEGPEQIEEASRNWGVETFDLMQVHNLLGAAPHLDMLFERKARGEIGHVGLTTSHGRRHDELEQLMRAHPVDFVQLTYNVLDREAEARLLPLAEERGISVIVNRPFRRGGLIQRTRHAPLPNFAAELGAVSWADLMLRFVLAHPAVTVVIPATTRPEHVRENKKAARRPLPDDELRARIAAEVAAL